MKRPKIKHKICVANLAHVEFNLAHDEDSFSLLFINFVKWMWKKECRHTSSATNTFSVVITIAMRYESSPPIEFHHVVNLSGRCFAFDDAILMHAIFEFHHPAIFQWAYILYFTWTFRFHTCMHLCCSWFIFIQKNKIHIPYYLFVFFQSILDFFSSIFFSI